nr:MAG TPA: hypothetical protein [Caudoviricetes sp.]DAM39740.1 MAG TPA: hypothetical protein [Caudoviricetes sp.]
MGIMPVMFGHRGFGRTNCSDRRPMFWNGKG